MKRRRCYCSKWKKYRGERMWKKRGIIAALLLVTATFSLLFLWEDELSPAAADLAANEAKRAAAKAVNETVEEVLRESGEEGQLIELEKSEEGEIQAILSDVTEMNLLRAEIASAVEEKIAGGSVRIGVPIGTLTGNSFLHGKGPKIPVTVTLAGSAEVDFNSEWKSAGLNQTLHRVVLNVHIGVYTFLEKDNVQEVETSVPLAETVIVGKVPQSALFSQSAVQ